MSGAYGLLIFSEPLAYPGSIARDALSWAVTVEVKKGGGTKRSVA